MDFSNLTGQIKWFLSGKDDYNKAIFISGAPGMGKTYAALNYCAENKNSLYFSFKNIDSSFALGVFCEAHPDIFSNSSDWHSFFERLAFYGKEKRPAVFFDSVGERNDKDEFYLELTLFLENNPDTAIILMGRPWDNIGVPYQELIAESLSTQEISELLSVSDKDAVSIFCLTSGIPALLSLYSTELSFEENLKAMLNTNSLFYRLVVEWMRESFRTPESYNTLLYGMANGQNRISELARFSCYPKNKCDKYIKALCEYGLVRKVHVKNGHTKYYPANSYLTLWYKTLLTAVPNGDGSFCEEVYSKFTQYFNDVVLSNFYKDMCYYWLKNNINSISIEYINTENEANRAVKLGDITFDFAYKGKRNTYAYFDTIFGNGLDITLWNKIEKASTADHPFYQNEYFLCTVNRVPDKFWKLNQIYDNVHIVQLKSLFAEYNKDYNRINHPRFVPSFVRSRGH